MPTVTLIYATLTAVPPVVEAFRSLPGIRLLNQVDEALLAEVERHGGLPSECVDRLHRQVSLAVEADSDIVLTTYNAYSSTVMHTIAPRFIPVPVLTVDEPLVRRAVQEDKIAVLGTVAAGLESQCELLNIVADEIGRRPHFTYALRSDSFDYLVAGDPLKHDRILIAEAELLARDFDVIVLAQASMARVLPHVAPRYVG